MADLVLYGLPMRIPFLVTSLIFKNPIISPCDFFLTTQLLDPDFRVSLRGPHGADFRGMVFSKGDMIVRGLVWASGPAIPAS